jgi:hypothetical protein
MSDANPKVIKSIHNTMVDRCVDIFVRRDGTWGFKEFRRDVEDQGAWFPISNREVGRFESLENAEIAARRNVAWLVDPYLK